MNFPSGTCSRSHSTLRTTQSHCAAVKAIPGTSPAHRSGVISGCQGIKYQFPVSDIDAIVFNGSSAPPAPAAGALIIPSGTDVPIRTNENIDSKNSYEDQTYSASVSEDIQDSDGHIATPAGSPAQLIITALNWCLISTA